MNYALYKTITSAARNINYDSATGNGSDASVDPGPKRDPNNFLAPVFGNEIFTTLASVAAILLITVLVLVSFRLLKKQI